MFTSQAVKSARFNAVSRNACVLWAALTIATACDSGQAPPTEVITSDGLYYRYMGMRCAGGTSVAKLKLGLSPVRQNQYDGCATTRLRLQADGIQREGVEFSYTWEQGADCNRNEVKIERVAVPLSVVSTSQSEGGACGSRDVRVGLLDYELRGVSRGDNADPLGQQPRLEGSIPPRASQPPRSLDWENHDLVVELQKRLKVVQRYDGPVDGRWNERMKESIRMMLDDQEFFFVSVQSHKVLELLDVHHGQN